MAKSRHRGRRRRRPRRVGNRPTRKTLLIFCEGRRTEPEYLKALKREPGVRERASIEFRKNTIGIGPPLALVKTAVKAIDRAAAHEDCRSGEEPHGGSPPSFKGGCWGIGLLGQRRWTLKLLGDTI